MHLQTTKHQTNYLRANIFVNSSILSFVYFVLPNCITEYYDVFVNTVVNNCIPIRRTRERIIFHIRNPYRHLLPVYCYLDATEWASRDVVVGWQ